MIYSIVWKFALLVLTFCAGETRLEWVTPFLWVIVELRFFFLFL